MECSSLILNFSFTVSIYSSFHSICWDQ